MYNLMYKMCILCQSVYKMSVKEYLLFFFFFNVRSGNSYETTLKVSIFLLPFNIMSPRHALIHLLYTNFFFLSFLGL